MYVFGPADGQSWGLTFDGLSTALRARTPEEFVRIDEEPQGPAPGGPSMLFGFTLEGETLEGIAAEKPEGASLLDSTTETAADFALWLRENIAPAGSAMVFNTEWGLEEDLPDTHLPEESREAMIAAFVQHLEDTGNLD
ncbi:hypothetical protein [Streptomyces sulphureus]|uniref:hypothetical protein n=1 Tax=Streptomyces sulphureus TaxID=47758 RepID=UPI000369C404|nr:hypothetical protein [Streptomyces sulphureus]